MNNLEDKKMKVLKQEEFDEFLKCDGTYMYRAVIEGYIVKDISINNSRVFNIDFENCRIESIKEFNVSFPFVAGTVSFHECVIVDYEKVDLINNVCISDCIFIKQVPLICPEEGEFVGYKKCWYFNFNNEGYKEYCIVKLLIPADAKRSSGFNNKCRCDKTKVLGIFDIYGNELKDAEAYSIFEYGITYKVGEEVYPDSFDEDRYNECSHGIHFFMTFKEARDYY